MGAKVRRNEDDGKEGGEWRRCFGVPEVKGGENGTGNGYNGRALRRLSEW